MISSGFEPLTRIHVTPEATIPPRITESAQTSRVRGTAASSRTNVAPVKLQSIRSPRHAAHAAGRSRLGDVEHAGRDQRHDQVKRHPAEIEDERLMGGSGADLAHPHELREAG